MRERHYGPKLRMLVSMIDQQISASLEDMDLTCSQGHVIGFVIHQEEMPCPRDVEEAFGLSHPTVSGLLSRLEKKGFLELIPDEHDRRCKRIHLLPKSEECMERLHTGIRQTEEKLVADFTPEEQARFFLLLDRAIRNLGGTVPAEIQKEEDMK